MKIVKSDLSSGSINNLLKILDNESTETGTLIDGINNFISDIDSGNLNGPAYKSVKERIQAYIPILSRRIVMASEMSSAIKSALKIMENYMGGDTMLDDSDLPLLKSTLDMVETCLQNILNSSELTKEMTSTINSFRAQIKELREEIEKLELLQPTDTSAYSNISSVQSNISEYQTLVNEVAGSKITINL